MPGRCPVDADTGRRNGDQPCFLHLIAAAILKLEQRLGIFEYDQTIKRP